MVLLMSFYVTYVQLCVGCITKAVERSTEGSVDLPYLICETSHSFLFTCKMVGLLCRDNEVELTLDFILQSLRIRVKYCSCVFNSIQM